MTIAGRIPGDRARTLVRVAVVLLFAIAFSWPTLSNDFSFDDTALLLDSKQSLQERVTQDFFGEDAQGHAASGYWRPVTALSYGIERKLYGDSPLGYHVDNLVLHASNSALLYGLLAAIPPLSAIALPAAVVFATHPVHAESIAPVTGRTDPLAFCFVLLAAHALLRRRSAIAALFFAFALGAKESSVALLPLVASIPLVTGERRRALRILAVLTGVAAIFFAVKIYGLSIVPPDGVYTGEGNVGQRALTFVALLPKYVGLVLWPAELTITHDAPLVTSLLDSRLFIGVLLIVVLLALLCLDRLDLRVGAAMFLLPLLPASNIVPITFAFRWMPFPFFERYLYVAVAGAAIVVTALVRDALAMRVGPRADRFTTGLVLVLSVVLGMRQVARAKEFQNDVVLFSSAATHARSTLEPQVQAAVWRYLSGDAVGALLELDRLLSQSPNDDSIAIERLTVEGAVVQAFQDEATKARARGDTAAATDIATRAQALIAEGRPRLDALRKKLPQNGRVVELLALFAGLEGDAYLAARLFREASELPNTTSELGPNFTRVCERLGAIARECANAGESGARQAILLYDRAIEAICGASPPSKIPEVVRDPVIKLWCELADQHVLVGDGAEASAAYVAILKIAPRTARCHEGIGYLCKQGGNREAAYEHFRAALTIDPESWYAINEMFTMLREDGRMEEAAEYAERFKRYLEKHSQARPESQTSPPREKFKPATVPK